ncbi:neural proliferation differentiation and control protein 1 isoform X2 [Electrophorus electricus]|uniref:neural proliferation differentiation and control protein 1 isoform X2 n=1 Tax=Electrophorus electricus TaxID=8005 RepID=UPI0015CFD687|nr:neural proliferation differentiation and control protein 1 isoform X2 [Electrophorus electricus]
MRSPRRGVRSRPWASLLIEAVLIATFTTSSAMTVGQCPRSLDCAREGRHFCEPGSSHCGPCLLPLVEDNRGRCVVRRRSHFKVPELDEEIDLLSSIITKHRESGMKHTAPSQDAPGIAEDSSRLRSHHRPKATVGSAPAHPVPSALTTLTAMGAPLGPGPSAPSSPSPVASVVQGVPLIVPYPPGDHSFTVVTGLCLMLGSVALVLAAVCWVRMQRATRLAQKADYSAFGVLNHHSYDVTSSGDKTLAQSAQMYHYQHQKQQMLSLKQRDEPKIPESGATSDEENEDGDFTVYECPGLAPTGEMEVKNPLFDDSTLHLHLNLQRSYN